MTDPSLMCLDLTLADGCGIDSTPQRQLLRPRIFKLRSQHRFQPFGDVYELSCRPWGPSVCECLGRRCGEKERWGRVPVSLLRHRVTLKGKETGLDVAEVAGTLG